MIDIDTLSSRLGKRRTALAISGGVDSMVLLHIIGNNIDRFACELSVVHVDHGLQVESRSWSDAVHEASRAHGIPCTTYRVDVPREGNLENQARRSRYIALTVGHEAIVTAHHMDDQAETMMMKMMRGSGTKGLSGMPEYGPCWIDGSVLHCRPMLAISREEIVGYARVCGIGHVEDPSNGDSSYDRNWLRNEIFPAIRSRKPDAVANMARTAAIMSEAVELSSALAEIDLAAVSRGDGTLDWPSLVRLGRTRAKNLIIHLVRSRTGNGCGTHHIEEFTDGLMSANSDSRNEFRSKGIVIRKIGHKIVL